MSGTTPPQAHSEQEAAAWVREMFGQVAPTYDRVNHLLSFNIDKYWRRRTVSHVQDILVRPDARVIDLCCGTGDLLLALNQQRQGVYGSDFCHPMLVEAKRKAEGATRRSIFESDALRLPLANGSFDLITMAFGFRNLANYEQGLLELRRVLRSGGKLAILEFTQPPNPLFAGLYNFYSKQILPRVGGAISGSREAYTYLPQSIRKFPDAPKLTQMMRDAGFRNASFEYLTFGIVALHIGAV